MKSLPMLRLFCFVKMNKNNLCNLTLNLHVLEGLIKHAFLDTKMFKGNAFDLYDKALDYLHFALPVAARIEPGKSNRVEEPAIPYKVLREALANALVHRDYSQCWRRDRLLRSMMIV